MRVRGGLATLFFAGVATFCGRADAQYFHVEPTVHSTIGYTFTRIVYDSPTLASVDQSGPLFTLAPSLALNYDTPRFTQRLVLTGTLSLPFTNKFTLTNREPLYSVRLVYTGSLPLDARTTMTLDGGFTATPVNAFSTLQDPTLTAIDAPPAEKSYNLSTTAGETLRHELSPEADVTETTALLYNFPFNDDPIRPSTLSVNNTLALSRRWTLDTLSLTGQVAVTHFTAGQASDGAVTDPRSQVLNSLIGTWRRAFTDALTASIHGGVSATVSPSATKHLAWAPAAGALINYVFDPVVVSVDYSYAAVVNIYTASTNLNNSALLRATLPFGGTGLSLSSTAGYLRSVPVADDTNQRGYDAYTADTGLTYSPRPIPKLSFSLRGLVARQVPLAQASEAVTRYSVIFNVGFSYPNTETASIFSRIAPAMTGASFGGGDQDFVVPEFQAVPDAPPAPAPEPAAPVVEPTAPTP